MKPSTRLAAGTLAVALGACGGVQPMTSNETNAAQRQVEAVLDDFHAAAAASDEARYFDHFSAEGVFLGTDATERWTLGESFMRRQVGRPAPQGKEPPACSR